MAPKQCVPFHVRSTVAAPAQFGSEGDLVVNSDTKETVVEKEKTYSKDVPGSFVIDALEALDHAVKHDLFELLSGFELAQVESKGAGVSLPVDDHDHELPAATRIRALRPGCGSGSDCSNRAIRIGMPGLCDLPDAETRLTSCVRTNQLRSHIAVGSLMEAPTHRRRSR
jgi:hypothetical protein